MFQSLSHIVDVTCVQAEIGSAWARCSNTFYICCYLFDCHLQTPLVVIDPAWRSCTYLRTACNCLAGMRCDVMVEAAEVFGREEFGRDDIFKSSFETTMHAVSFPSGQLSILIWSSSYFTNACFFVSLTGVCSRDWCRTVNQFWAFKAHNNKCSGSKPATLLVLCHDFVTASSGDDYKVFTLSFMVFRKAKFFGGSESTEKH